MKWSNVEKMYKKREKERNKKEIKSVHIGYLKFKISAIDKKYAILSYYHYYYLPMELCWIP